MPRIPAPTYLPLVRDLSDWDDAVKGIANDRTIELAELILADRLVPLPASTAFAVEEDFATLLRVRVLDGEHRGATGWLPSSLPIRTAA